MDCGDHDLRGTSPFTKTTIIRVIPTWKGHLMVRWIGFVLAVLGVYLLSTANPSIQHWGWLLSEISCAIWVYAGIRDRDIARTCMEICYTFLAIRGRINWWP